MDPYKNFIVGCSLSALFQEQAHSKKSFSWNTAFLESFIKSNQIHIQLDKFGQFSGLAIWTSVSKEISQRLLRCGRDSLGPEDINSGNETWLIELCALNGGLHQLLHALRDDFLRETPQVTYFRIKNTRRIAKRIARTDCTSSSLQNPCDLHECLRSGVIPNGQNSQRHIQWRLFSGSF